MVMVLLKRDFIARGAVKYRRVASGNDILREHCYDEEGNSILPSDAKILKEEAMTEAEVEEAVEEKKAAEKSEPKALSELSEAEVALPAAAARTKK